VSNKENEMTMIELRKAEAERIARAEGFAIAEHDEDWGGFMLDDPLDVGAEGSMNRHFAQGQTLRTAFTWEAGRFEGFVTFAEPTK